VLEGEILDAGHARSVGGGFTGGPSKPILSLRLMMRTRLKLAAAFSLIAYAGGAAALLWHRR
jgi:hypothetical protein